MDALSTTLACACWIFALSAFGPTLAAPQTGSAELTAWGEWSPCSRPCGGGRQGRRRVCRPIFDPETCLFLKSRLSWSDLVESRPCNTRRCEVTGEWSEWGAWQPCSSSCGSSSFRVRRRSCLPAAGTGPQAAAASPVCSGKEIESQACESLPPCPGSIPEQEFESSWSSVSFSSGRPNEAEVLAAVDGSESFSSLHSVVAREEKGSSASESFISHTGPDEQQVEGRRVPTDSSASVSH